MNGGRRLEGLLAAAAGLSIFVAARPALGAFHVPGGAGLVAAAAGGSALMAFVDVSILGIGPTASYILSTIGLVIVLLIADGPHAGAVASALEHGPSRVLTETLPLTGSRSIAAPLVVAVWLSGAAMGEMLLRARRRPAALPLAIPPALYVLCFGLSAGAPRPDRVGGPALLVALAVVASLRLRLAQRGTDDPELGWADPRPARRRPAAGILACASLAAGLAVLVPSVPFITGAPLGLHRRSPTVVPVITDPVASMAASREGPVQPVLTVQMSASSVGYLAAAYLDDYDGAHWGFSATFRPTGGRVPAPANPASGLALANPASGPAVVQRIDVSGPLPVPLLPALDRPVSVRGRHVAADQRTGMLLPIEVATGRPAVGAYTVVSRAPDRTILGLAPADGIDPSLGAQSDLQIPPDTSADLSIMVRYLSSLVGVGRPAGSVAFLQSAVRALQVDERRVDPGEGLGGRVSPVGTSLSEVIDAVTVQRTATPEQLATFLAVVARDPGVPARLVTGFRIPPSSDGHLFPAGIYRVSNRQVWSWLEIPVAGFGWVICDPAPDLVGTSAAPPPEAESAAPSTVPPHSAEAIPRSQSAGGHPLAPPTRIGSRARGRHSTWIGWLAAGGPGVVVLLVLFALVALVALMAGPVVAGLRRAGRRRIRRSPEPAAAAVGAWLEVLDTLDRAGMRWSGAATASEVVTEVGHHFGTELIRPAAAVAALADRAVFCTTQAVEPGEARQSWGRVAELRYQLRSGMDRRQRIRSWLTVGSAPVRPDAALTPGDRGVVGRAE